jgi:DNA-binding XRE family transcriptional regulator
MGRQMSERAEFHVRGQPLDGTPLHYTASGLDYVYLRSGFTVEDDPDYGRIVTIDDEDSLHRSIGLYIVTRSRPLTGAEFRFLRKQMRYTQKALADDIGVNEQTVANYEKGKPIPQRAENYIRLTFIVWMTPEHARADVIKRLAMEVKQLKKTLRKPTPATISCVPPTDIQNSIAAPWQMEVGSESPIICRII